MGLILEKLADDEVAVAIEDGLVEVCRNWDVWPGVEFREEAGLQWISSDVPYPLFNAVLRTRLTGGRAGETIDRLAAGARGRGLPLAWLVSPLTEPADMGERLVEKGFQHGPVTIGMAADLDAIEWSEMAPANLVVEEVRDTEGLRTWRDVVISVYNFPGFVAGPWLELHEAMGLGPDKPWRHYVGRLGTTPVAAATLFLWPGSAFLANVATVPEARQMGIGTAITLRALAEARDRGYRLATLCSSRMGLGLYKRLGFCEYSRFMFYTLRGYGAQSRQWRVRDVERGWMF